MSGPPDLSTPEGLEAYRRELRGVAWRWRAAGIAVTLTGVALGLSRYFIEPWPDTLRNVTLVLCVAGVAIMGFGIYRRTSYHLRRMRGEG